MTVNWMGTSASGGCIRPSGRMRIETSRVIAVDLGFRADAGCIRPSGRMRIETSLVRLPMRVGKADVASGLLAG